MDLPAYLSNSGFTSKLSRWLTPPQRKIQMTDLAFGRDAGEALARSRKSIAPRARPVKPMPVSTRNERRVMPWQPADLRFTIFDLRVMSANGHKVRMIEQNQKQVFTSVLGV